MNPKQQSILLGAAIVALLSTSYLSFINCLCCLGVILGAVVSVWHYTETNALTIKPGEGAVMGLAAAIIGSIVAIFLNYILISIGIRHDAALIDGMINMFGDAMNPDQLDELRAQTQETAGFGSHLLNGLLGAAIAGIFGAIGGAIGAAMFKKGGTADDPATDVAI